MKPTLKERLEEVNSKLEKAPTPELLKEKSEIEAGLAKVAAMQAGKNKGEEPKEEPKKSRKFIVSGKPSADMILAAVFQLEKKYTGKKDETGTALFNLNEVKKLKEVKILREHLVIHEEQEANTLKRYKEIK